MIRFQIVEHHGAGLRKKMLEKMRSGALQTFSSSKRGRKISHVKHPGWIKWTDSEGVITCEVLSPHKPNDEWLLLHAFLGRLAARFALSIAAINIQFPISHISTNTTIERRRNAARRRKV